MVHLAAMAAAGLGAGVGWALLVCGRSAEARERLFGRRRSRPAVCVEAAARTGLVLAGAGLGLWIVHDRLASGLWWRWEARENLALAAFLVFLTYPHLASMSRWNARRASWALVAVFAALVVGWWGWTAFPLAAGIVE
jgi:hypothetical protein